MSKRLDLEAANPCYRLEPFSGFGINLEEFVTDEILNSNLFQNLGNVILPTLTTD